MTDLKSLSRQRYTPEFKLRLVRMALKTLEENGSVAALAREHNVNDNLLFKWIRLWKKGGACGQTPRAKSKTGTTSRARTGSDSPSAPRSPSSARHHCRLYHPPPGRRNITP